MKNTTRCTLFLLAMTIAAAPVPAAETDNPFIGNWALTIPGGGAGWLGVTQEKGYLDASILWGGGSVVPVASVYVDGDTLYVTRIREVKRKGAKAKVVRTHTFTETITANLSGDSLSLTQSQPRTSGKGTSTNTFTGKRIPPLPPKPNLAKARYGEPVTLFNGKDLDGWQLLNPRRTNGWSVIDGALINDPVQERGKPRKAYGNLRTVDEFEDFNLTLDVSVDKHGNSGIYLRGIYEVQIFESYGKDLDSHNMAAIYSRITPSVAAERPPGEWQTLDITLLDRHVTVILNGKTIIDNEPLLGCTGGALWSDEFKPGPIYLQGDHSAVKFRNMVLTPVQRDN